MRVRRKRIHFKTVARAGYYNIVIIARNTRVETDPVNSVIAQQVQEERALLRIV